jgi:hypothetical protein
MTGPPLVVVLGRPNVGKSGVAAALAAHTDVATGEHPFTTTETRELPVEAGGATLLRLLDTPGLQETARALHLLRAAPDPDPTAHLGRLEEFLRLHSSGEEFREERLALSPLLSGASFILVLDGSRPFRRNHEAEMELLRWTGSPGLAVLNRTRPGEPDHSDEWEAVLRRHFPTVRRFDAQAATVDDRLALVEALGLLRPELGSAARQFREALAEQRRSRRHEAAREIGRMLVDNLTHADQVAAVDEGSLDDQRQALEDRFHGALQEREQRGRAAVEKAYGFTAGGFRSADIEKPVFETDLFAEDVWRDFGLTPQQLVLAGAAGGAATGAAVDVAAGGHTLGSAALVGGLLGGGAAAYRVSRPRIRAHDGGLVESGKRLWKALSGDPRAPRFTIGPHEGGNFPWVLLDRALLHFEAVARRSHARKGDVQVAQGYVREHPALAFARARRKELAQVFQEIRAGHRSPPPDAADRLAALVEPVLERIDEGPRPLRSG